jgi:hypothetical protein
MNGRRKLLVLALAITPVLAIGAACSFPDVSFAPAGSGSEGGTDGGNSDAPVTVDAHVVGANEDVDPTGAMMDASTVPDAQRIEAGPAGCCDCDMDGYKPDSGSDAAMCANLPSRDCDDLNMYVNPDSGFVASATFDSPHTPSFDWNCDGTRTKQYDYNQPCTDPNNCNGKSGFKDDPNCGESGIINVCQYNPGVAGLVLASCKVGSTVMATQACK